MGEKYQNDMKVRRERGCDGEERKIVLASKILHVHYKTFYLKLIKEKPGTFIEITELFCKQYRSQIVLGLSSARELRNHIVDFVLF